LEKQGQPHTHHRFISPEALRPAVSRGLLWAKENYFISVCYTSFPPQKNPAYRKRHPG